MFNVTNNKLSDFKTVIVLLAIFILSSVAFLVILRLDLFVNNELYEFGLQLNTNWGQQLLL